MTEALEADLARLRADLAGARDELAQRDRAIVAAHRAIEIAQADNVVLTTALLNWIGSVGTKRFADYDDALAKLARSLRTRAHPGAALLAELDAARAALDQIDRHVIGAYSLSWDAMPEPCDECGEMREIASQALAAMKKVRKT